MGLKPIHAVLIFAAALGVFLVMQLAFTGGYLDQIDKVNSLKAALKRSDKRIAALQADRCRLQEMYDKAVLELYGGEADSQAEEGVSKK